MSQGCSFISMDKTRWRQTIRPKRYISMSLQPACAYKSKHFKHVGWCFALLQCTKASLTHSTRERFHCLWVKKWRLVSQDDVTGGIRRHATLQLKPRWPGHTLHARTHIYDRDALMNKLPPAHFEICTCYSPPCDPCLRSLSVWCSRCLSLSHVQRDGVGNGGGQREALSSSGVM